MNKSKLKVRKKAPTHIEAMGFNIFLGMLARHKLTGFHGRITGFAQHLTGCDRYCVSPVELDEKGLMKEGNWFDLNELELLEGDRVIFDDDRQEMKPVFVEHNPESAPRGAMKDAPTRNGSI